MHKATQLSPDRRRAAWGAGRDAGAVAWGQFNIAVAAALAVGTR
jgi:hypothetical protein